MSNEQPSQEKKKLSSAFADASGYVEYFETLGKDRIPDNVHLDAVYVFTLTADAQHEATEVAVKLYKDGRAGKIIVNNATTETGYAGVAFVRKLLAEAGIPTEDIVEITTTINLTTKTETDPLMEYCVSHGITNLAVASAPFHYRRAYVSSVTTAIDKGLGDSLNIWPAKFLPKNYDWREITRHSQGTLKKKKIGLVDTEIERMDTYAINEAHVPDGTLKPWVEIKAYMQARDRRVKEAS
ncbi:MAG: hypothetical protein A3A33_01515 [Candidatus Yanofskybacteria bacterium RIFCSPLOWO2_01_FULL_49_25]|uniref:Uncharacterized protein n=1 Tax=Candidatus Yanofskybacteria bacterium RIFCSPLOWO2_01_FULL_49_25 TaxID=1802701 RepID=A0A1F8GX29_9BACT|nr:MAG: hypothetical protein A3A33_01515 [Candidatus Yanofskybacteria bacterium RIFCSPLOWO2_01_FULL_49_25]